MTHFLRFLVAALLLLTLPARAEEARVYVFGNSLVHHLDGGSETNVPIWLDRMAKAQGHSLALDGEWGFLRNFAEAPVPKPNWSFRGIKPALRRGSSDLGSADLSAVIITPANFLQFARPHKPYWDEGRRGASPLTATLEIIDAVQEQAPGVPILLYEGWADMGEYAETIPPTPAAYDEYLDYLQGDYHDWFIEWQDELRKARPQADIRIVPVSSTLARAYRETVLRNLDTEALYDDTAPHGTATKYMLAAMALYPALYGEPAPALDDLPGIAPLVADNIEEIAHFFATGEATATETAAAEPTSTPLQPSATPDRFAPKTEVQSISLTNQRSQGMADPTLAFGLNGVADWTVQQPFLDVMKTARPWIGHRDGQWGAWQHEDLFEGGHLNAQGWPISLPEGATVLEALLMTDLSENSTTLSGRYRITWEGTGTLRLAGRASRVSINEAEREAWFAFTPGEGSVAVVVEETDARDPIRDIVVLHERHVPFWEAGALFNPDWLAVVQDARSVRFMDWTQTNGSMVETWEDRPKLTDFTYSWRGVPLEVMLRLANEIGADPWFCMPHMADDGYVRAFAGAVRDGLDPRLVSYVEYSNEVWNFIFPQAHYAAEQAKALWGRKAEGDGWMQFAGMRAARVGAIWHEVFGDEAEARVKRVVAVHTGWLGLEEPLIDAPLWRAGDPDAPPPSETFDAYAVTGYFGHELGGDEMATTMHELAAAGAEGEEAAARILRDGSLSELIDILYPHHAAVTQTHGYELIMYEGGTHVAGLGAQIESEALTDFYIRLNYSDEMAVLYDELLYGFRAHGGTLFNAFVDVATPTQHGSWGALRYLGDDNLRWQALQAYNAESGSWEARGPGTFLHGLRLIGGDGADVLAGSAEEDTLLGGGGDDVLVGNGGADHIHGGEGIDMAVLPGTPEDYVFTPQGPRLVAEQAGLHLNLASVELLQFTGAPGLILDTASLTE
jgi:hypothetical protein